MKFSTTRLAPTPSGYLHIGNVVNFLTTAALARKMDAKILLRIDDLDLSRKRPEYVKDIFNTLTFLGIPYDEGPADPLDFEQNWSQHRRLEMYQEAFESLKINNLVFACQCSRKQVSLASKNGRYPGTCRNKSLDNNRVCNWRFRIEAFTSTKVNPIAGTVESLQLSKRMQDFVVWKKDGLPAYQLASLMDDLHFDVDLIVRGKDLSRSTAAQLLLAKALKRPSFLNAHFHHHSLILTPENKKLSKSAGSISIHYMRSIGLEPEDVYRQVSVLMGLEKVVTNFGEFLEVYSFRK